MSSFFRRMSLTLVCRPSSQALDALSEKRVGDGLATAMQGRSVLIIAHRLSTVRHADLVLVLDDGAIVERGTHEELMRARGIYAAMVKIQGESEKAT